MYAISERRPARWPWLGVIAFLTLAFIGSIFVVENGTGLLDDVPFILAFGMFGAVGAMIMSRQPGNRVGALLLYGSGITALSFVCGELTTYLIRQGVTDGPWVITAALFSNVGWLFGILPVLLLMPLLFPDGHLPSRRWIAVPIAMFVFLMLTLIGFVFGERQLSGSIETLAVENPLYVPAIAALDIPDWVFEVGLLALLITSVASVVVRFRRARGPERQQIKWVAFAFLFLLVATVVSEVSLSLGIDNPWIEVVMVGGAYLAVPVAIGIAVLQFRLYELDVVVKKTLVAGAFALVVIAIYGAVVGSFGLFATDQDSAGWLFIVALGLGLAFRPVARFARRVADRIVYGGRATPYEVLTEFSERVGDAYATEDVLGRMAQILAQAVGATSARVWLRVAGEVQPAATWPPDAPAPRPVTAGDEELPDLAGEFAVEVRDRGELLGALSVVMPANDPMDPSKERLVRDLAAQAGLALRNVRLVEELRALQRRLVTAQDQERRRLERDIHDGSQQQLVALSVKARLARALTETQPEKAAEMLSQMESELQVALEDLRDLARGIYPPLLADKGLGPALEAQARRLPVPVAVDTDGVGRYAQEVEAAVYFSCLEALQNVAKHSGATSATVTLAQTNGTLTFEVTDDGHGFETHAIGYGSGLQGIADRLAALHGEFAVLSKPGGGTKVIGKVEVGG